MVLWYNLHMRPQKEEGEKGGRKRGRERGRERGRKGFLKKSLRQAFLPKTPNWRFCRTASWARSSGSLESRALGGRGERIRSSGWALAGGSTWAAQDPYLPQSCKLGSVLIPFCRWIIDIMRLWTLPQSTQLASENCLLSPALVPCVWEKVKGRSFALPLNMDANTAQESFPSLPVPAFTASCGGHLHL